MGEDGEAFLEAEIEAAGHRLADEHDKMERRERVDLATAAMPALAQQLAALKLTIKRCSEHHYQVLRRGVVVAQWWPSRGTTMIGGDRGRRCNTAAQFAKWLRRAIDSQNRRQDNGR